MNQNEAPSLYEKHDADNRPPAQPLMAAFWYHLTFGNFCKPLVRRMTPLMQVSREIEVAEFDLLEHVWLTEYHSAISAMLRDRLSRLRVDLLRLSRECSTTLEDKA